MNVDKPYCPTCKRRLHKVTALERPCLVCGQPVQGVGAGRPRQLHPQCRARRAAWRMQQQRKRQGAKQEEVRP